MPPVRWHRWIVIVAAGLAVGGGSSCRADGPESLSRVEADGYLLWLHSLERTVAAREAAQVAEPLRLFPSDQESPAAPPLGDRYLILGRALIDAERDKDAPAQGAGPALSMARNYARLSEHDSALVWFDRAARRDTAGDFAAEIQHEALAAATAWQDSAELARRLIACTEPGPIPKQATALVTALRYLTAHRRDALLDAVLARLAAADTELEPRLVFWSAYALAYRQRYSESLADLRQLIAGGGLSQDLDERQRAWVLLAMPDLFFLAGSEATARELYGALAGSQLDALAREAEFRLAGLELAAAAYARAAERYERLCEARETGWWRDRACALVGIATELQRIKSEGASYGAAAYYGR